MKTSTVKKTYTHELKSYMVINPYLRAYFYDQDAWASKSQWGMENDELERNIRVIFKYNPFEGMSEAVKGFIEKFLAENAHLIGGEYDEIDEDHYYYMPSDDILNNMIVAFNSHFEGKIQITYMAS